MNFCLYFNISKEGDRKHWRRKGRVTCSKGPEPDSNQGNYSYVAAIKALSFGYLTSINYAGIKQTAVKLDFYNKFYPDARGS